MAEPQTHTGNGLTVTIADPENINKCECLGCTDLQDKATLIAAWKS